jgi:molybdenum cofactor guanylyltransferase
MGRDKLPLTVGGVPILRRACDALRASCDEVIAVVAGSTEPGGLPEGSRAVRDLRIEPGGAGAGPLAGLESGLYHAQYPEAFAVAGDMPFLSPALVSEALRRLRLSGAYAVVPRVGGRWEPLCAAYSREALSYVSRALDDGVRVVRDLVESLPVVEEITLEDLRRFGKPELLLMNVNSPEELAFARKWAGGEIG